MTTPTKQAADRRYAGTDNDGYRAMRTQLQAFIARRVESTQAAEDLTQEVLLRLVRSNADEFADPAAWLYRVARNVIIDHYRTRRPIPARIEASELSNSVDPFADDPSLARQELAQCLRSLINQLDEPYRSAITAVDLDGRTHASVAAQTGLSVPGVKSRVQRARRQLRHLLTDCCDVQTSADGTVVDYTAPPSCTARIGCTG
jgi:RNA polymerase sigma-70 factor (ECF subfamily)